MVDEPIIAVVRSYLAAVREAGIHASKAVVFGSHARGGASDDSDIDLLVVAPEFDNARDRALTQLLWRLRLTTDRRIEPIGVGERQWENAHSHPLLTVAREEGLVISAA